MLWYYTSFINPGWGVWMERESCSRTWQVQTKPAAGASPNTTGWASGRQADVGNCEAGTRARVQDKTGGTCQIAGNRKRKIMGSISNYV